MKNRQSEASRWLEQAEEDATYEFRDLESRGGGTVLSEEGTSSCADPRLYGPIGNRRPSAFIGGSVSI